MLGDDERLLVPAKTAADQHVTPQPGGQTIATTAAVGA